MIPRERVLAALERKPVDRVSFVETAIGLNIGDLLGAFPERTVQRPDLWITPYKTHPLA